MLTVIYVEPDLVLAVIDQQNLKTLIKLLSYVFFFFELSDFKSLENGVHELEVGLVRKCVVRDVETQQLAPIIIFK